MVVTALIACAVPPTHPPTVQTPFPDAPAFRLPHTFEPRSYRARLALSDGHFTGHIEIVGDVSEVLPVIWLHANNLVVSSATATREAATVALEHMARMATKLAKLEPFDLVMLFHDACDASQRAQLVALAKSAAVDLDNVLAEVDRCITQRQAMEPVFRAWLDPTSSLTTHRLR